MKSPATMMKQYFSASICDEGVVEVLLRRAEQAVAEHDGRERARLGRHAVGNQRGEVARRAGRSASAAPSAPRVMIESSFSPSVRKFGDLNVPT